MAKKDLLLKKQTTIANIINKPGYALICAAGLLLLLVKLVLADAQNVLLWPDEALLDDMLMYGSAQAITAGEWLGEYGWTTLSKHSFFALWLAGLNALGIPFLLGGQLLWAAAALAGAAAVSPLIKNRWAKLFMFAVLLYSPSSTANPFSTELSGGPLGFVSRVYRDNIFPALCLLCVAGMIGFALRCKKPLRRSVWWLVLAGGALAACYLCREDGWWLLPFVVAGSVVCAVYMLRVKQGGAGSVAKDEEQSLAFAALPLKKRILRCLVLLLPFVILLAGLGGWAAKNSAVYGRFIISDFSSGEFADAYGAMTRIEHENWNPKIAVPYDVRQQLYEHVPAFAELEPYLEGESMLNRYAGDADYSSGAFYWALREAAAACGHYSSPQAAQAFFEGLAADINALCDSGTLAAAHGQRSSVSPPIRAEYIGPVLTEGLYNVWFSATFMQCEPHSLFSPGGNDAVHYAEKLQPMEEYLNEAALTATQANSTLPYYTPYQQAAFFVLQAVRYVYAFVTPLAFAAALVWQVLAAVKLFAGLKKRNSSPSGWLVWFVMLGLLFCILLRAFMVAFVSVSSFTIGPYVMYLASIHPLLLLYAMLGAGMLFMQWRKKRGGVPWRS